MGKLWALSEAPIIGKDPKELPEGRNSFLVGNGQGKHRVTAVGALSAFWEKRESGIGAQHR